MIIKNLSVRYGSNIVYKDFSLKTSDDKVTCILGESGCGKTTLLNAIAGLVPHSGEVEVGKISYVFQTHRLVPNLTVLQNLTLVGISAEEGESMLNRVGLGEKVNAYIRTLSGGELQRVALLRAFLYPADLLLMDEPFSSLDLRTKLSVMDLFLSLKKSTERGAVFVTHDIDEALYLADRIILICGGRIVADYNLEDECAESSECAHTSVSSASENKTTAPLPIAEEDDGNAVVDSASAAPGIPDSMRVGEKVTARTFGRSTLLRERIINQLLQSQPSTLQSRP